MIISESVKRSDSFLEGELKRRYDQRNKMFHEICLLFEDQQLIYEIGSKNFFEFDTQVLNPAIELFHHGDPKELWKYRGVKLSLIKYYCDTFNTGNNDEFRTMV